VTLGLPGAVKLSGMVVLLYRRYSMEVIVEKGKLGTSTYHIWDYDNREIVLHRPDVVELIRRLQIALQGDKS